MDLARYQQSPRAECRPLPGVAAWYQDIRANMEQTRKPEGLDHYAKMATTRTGRRIRPRGEPGPGLPRAVDTIRNPRQYRLGKPVAEPGNGPGRRASDIPPVYPGCTRVRRRHGMARSAAEPARQPQPSIRPGHIR
jgi:hypothetical protein